VVLQILAHPRRVDDDVDAEVPQVGCRADARCKNSSLFLHVSR
jgi:hypothetical protein